MEENNIVVAVFNDDSKAYQVLSESKSKSHEQYKILDAAVIQKENGKIVFKDGFSSPSEADTSALKSSLIGSIIGILGGPIGILLGGSIGSMIGANKVVNRHKEGFSLIERTVAELYNGETAFVANIKENNEIAFNYFLQQYDPKFVYRKEVSMMEHEMNKAREMEQQLAQEEEERKRKERAEDMQEKAEEMKERIKSEFHRIKEKLTEK